MTAKKLLREISQLQGHSFALTRQARFQGGFEDEVSRVIELLFQNLKIDYEVYNELQNILGELYLKPSSTDKLLNKFKQIAKNIRADEEDDY